MRRPGGAFPVRAPVGLLLGTLVAALLLPCWLWLGFKTASQMQRFYLGSYVKSGWQAAFPNVGLKPYPVALIGDNLAVQESLDDHPKQARVVVMQVSPAKLHAWLKKAVYGGSVQRMFRWSMCCSFVTFLGLCGLGLWWDTKRRMDARDGDHLRGTELMRSCAQFNRRALHGRREAGIVLPAGPRGQRVVIPRELEAHHIAIFGSTGSGKSTEIRHILYQVKARGDVAVIYDPKGEYRDEFYSEEDGDIIFDPTDQRCPYWAIESEAADEAKATPWAMAFWPDEPRQQPFFKKHPRAIFAYLLSRYSAYNEREEPATCAALGYWLSMPIEREILPRLKGTEHADSLKRPSDQSQGLKSTLGEIAKPLRMMPQTREDRREFTVRGWSESRKGWVFMTSTPDTVDALLPLHSAIMDMLILTNQASALGGAPRPAVWFVIDEVATLQRLPQLEAGMTKQRASGNPIILGFHDMAQLKKRYGDEGAVTIMSQAWTNILFRTGDPAAAAYAEKMIGHHEIERITENRPVHMLTTHRARSWSNQTVDTPVISAAEIQGLPRFTGYLLQEGKVVRIQIQKLARRERTGRLERLIPPVIFREPPERDLAESDDVIASLGI